MSLRSILRRCACVSALLPLACAVATGQPEEAPEPDASGGDGAQTSGAGGAAGAGSPASGASPTTNGGKSGAAGSTTSGGTANAGGRGGTAGVGGKGGTSSGSGGGASSAGSMSTGGAATGGASMGGSAGTGATDCASIKAWKGGDPTLSIAKDEVIQWMGKRYKANQAIAYPNTECAPDAPAMWCQAWFSPEGSC